MRKSGKTSYVEKKTFLLHAQEVLRLHFVECTDSHDCRLQSSARGEILNCHWSMIRTLSKVLFPIEYAVKSIAGTRCLSWITLSTQSGFYHKWAVESSHLSIQSSKKRCLFSVRPGWDDERHVRHLWRLHHHLSDSPHGRHLLPALQEALLQATKNTNTNTNEKIQIKLMVATFSMLYKKHMYVQAGTSRYQSSSGRMLLRNQIMARRMQALGSDRTAKEEIIFNLATYGGISGVDLPLL